MKKATSKLRAVIICVTMLGTLVLCSCSAPKQFSFVTGIEEMSFENPFHSKSSSDQINDAITLEDVDKYNEIMDELSDFSRSEQEIIEEIAPNYNMSPEELVNFMVIVMPYATGSIKIENQNELTNEQLIQCIGIVLDKIVIIEDGTIAVSGSMNDWRFEETDLRYLITTNRLSINDDMHDFIIKIEFDGIYYESFRILQIKLDDKNIDLK